MLRSLSCFALLSCLVLAGCLMPAWQDRDWAGEQPPMLEIPAGSFEMGCTAAPLADGNCASREGPAHTVTLTDSFYLAETELTQAQWEAQTGNNPSFFFSCGSDCPVEYINWYEALAFTNLLSAQQGLQECFTFSGCFPSEELGSDMDCDAVLVNSASGSVYDCEGYRLPTEAEWEYAARAGTDLLYAGSDSIEEVAWHESNSEEHTSPVGALAPNGWGLHDMSGNVREWTWDWYESDYYSSSEAGDDPENSGGSQSRVTRGGDWQHLARTARVADRGWGGPGTPHTHLGFRIARSSTE